MAKKQQPGSKYEKVVCAAIALSIVLAAFFLFGLFLLQAMAVVLLREDWSDIQYQDILYLGRRTSTVKIDVAPHMDDTVTLTNQHSETVRNLSIKAKYFGSYGRRVVTWQHDELRPGASIVLQPPEGTFDLDLGMIYVMVRSSHGITLERAKWSYWY